MTKKQSVFIIVLLTSLMITPFYAQEGETFVITPDLINEIPENNTLMYKVVYEEVDFPVYKKGEKLTKYYLEQKKELLKYKPAFTSYINEEKKSQKQFLEIQEILKYIEDFNTSDDKYKNKVNYLINAQKIADKYNLEFIKQSGNVNIPSREILIYNPKKRTRENDLELYKNYVKSLKIETPYKTYDYKKYIDLKEYLKTIDSTEEALIKTNEVTLKKVYMAKSEPLDIKLLNGTYIKLKGSYMLVYSDFEDKYLKNQLINPTSYPSSLKVSKRYSIIKNVETGEYYYLTDDSLLSYIKRQKDIEEYAKMSTNSDYIKWKTKYERTIALAQANIDKCESIIKKHTFRNAFGEKMYDTSDFTESEKKIFNDNLDKLGKRNKEIGELETQKKYYHYWNNNVDMNKSTSSYRLSSYYNSKNKAY